MGAYNCKYVRDQLPHYLTDEVEGYEGGCDYDGDMWAAASDYIDALERELAKQYAQTKTMHDEKLLNWLKTRPKSHYNAGPAVVDA
jgi:cytochrome c553